MSGINLNIDYSIKYHSGIGLYYNVSVHLNILKGDDELYMSILYFSLSLSLSLFLSLSLSLSFFLSPLTSFNYCLVFLIVVSPVITNNSGVVDQVMGQEAIFQCTAVSEPVHITNWTFNGTPLSNSDKYLIQVCECQNMMIIIPKFLL